MKKTIELWSISDYITFFDEEVISIKEFWEERLLTISKDPFKAFISLASSSDLTSPKEIPRSQLFTSVPIVVKDNICTKSFPTTCSSKMLETWTPDFNASVITNLQSEGTFILGKSNLDEFAMGNTTATSYYGKSFNPWDPSKRFTPGGSSGGSAVAVALGYAPIAIGSDTGGSIRCPASFCGVLGLKPTYGRVSRYGLISYAHSLDQIGIVARYAEDVSKTLEIIARPDIKDMTYKNKPYFNQNLDMTRKIIVGISDTLFESVPQDQGKLLRSALNKLEDKGLIELKQIKLDDLDILLPTYYVTAFSEAYSNLSRFSGQHFGFDAGNIISTRLQGFGEEVQRRFELGSFSLKTGFEEQLYSKSQKIRTYFKEKLQYIFNSVHAIALPTMLDVAYSWDEIQNPVDSYKADLLTVPANLAGIPAITIPVGFTTKQSVKLPVGLQLFGSWWQERLLIQIAHEYQKLTDFHLQLPPDQII